MDLIVHKFYLNNSIKNKHNIKLYESTKTFEEVKAKTKKGQENNEQV